MRPLLCTILSLLALVASAATLQSNPSNGIAPDDKSKFSLLRLDGHLVKWYRLSHLTYDVATDTRAYPGARNCDSITGIEDLLNGSNISRSSFMKELDSAFKKWEPLVGMQFRKARANERADITIGVQTEPYGWAFANVAYDSSSSLQTKPITSALICFNHTRRWKIGFDGNREIYDLQYTLVHEIGHALGLDHPHSRGQLMDHRYNEQFREPQKGDVLGIRALYGIRGQENTLPLAWMPEERPPTVLWTAP